MFQVLDIHLSGHYINLVIRLQRNIQMQNNLQKIRKGLVLLMRIVFVRHGEPDYKNDTLTEKGWREAELAAKRISEWKVTDFYCSPLGRAKDTASCTLKLVNREAAILPWMSEFSYSIDDPTTGRHSIPWDFVPSFWTNEPLMYDIDKWVESDVMKQNPQIALAYKEVCENFDALLASYGYIRENNFYRMPDNTFPFLPPPSIIFVQKILQFLEI